MNPIEILVDECFHQVPSVTSRRPWVLPADIEPVRIHVQGGGVPTVNTVPPMAVDPQFPPDERAAVFLTQPFFGRFEMTLCDLMLSCPVLPMQGSPADAVLMVGPHSLHDVWRNFWARIDVRNCLAYSQFDYRNVPTFFYNHYTEVRDGDLLFSLASFHPASIWIQRAELLTDPDRWAVIVDYLRQRFDNVELVLSPQSAFPVPQSFILAYNRRTNDFPPPPFDRHPEKIIRTDTRDAFARLHQTFRHNLERSKVRAEWIQSHSQEKAFGDFIDCPYATRLKTCVDPIRPATPQYDYDVPFY